MRHVRSITLALAAALVVAPSLAEAQRVIVRRSPASERQPVRHARDYQPARQMTLAVGVLAHDGASDDNFAMAALRTDWRLAHWLRSELSVSYTLAEVDAPVGSAASDVDSHLLHASVGLNAELPVPVIRPYVGIAGGLFGRFDGEGGEDFVRPSVAVPVGLRVPLTPRLGLRAEVRWRFDQQEGGGDAAVNREQTVGVSFAF